MRLFIGIPPATEVIDALEALSQRLRFAEDGFRWSSPVSWHITLQFLGETPESQYACLLAHLKNVRSPAFRVQIDGTGFFNRAGVFFAGVSDSPQLAQLQKQVVAATAHCGFVAEDRLFHPHITLVRAKGAARTRALRHLKTRIKSGVTFPPSLPMSFFSTKRFSVREAPATRSGSDSLLRIAERRQPFVRLNKTPL